MTVLVPDALDANKAGRLAAPQRDNLRAMSRGLRGCRRTPASRPASRCVDHLVGDRAKAAEARAELAAIGNAMTGQIQAGSTRPPGSDRDQRPLAEAIVGTWRNPMMTLTFAGDGTASMTSSMGAMNRDGHWSVDSGGRQVADVSGSVGPVDARIAGDRLTLSIGGSGIAFELASD